MKLFKLPNGSWVDPMTITSIHVIDPLPNTKPGTTVVHGNHHPAYTFIEFDTIEDARKFADEIGQMVNRRFQILLENKEAK